MHLQLFRNSAKQISYEQQQLIYKQISQSFPHFLVICLTIGVQAEESSWGLQSQVKQFFWQLLNIFCISQQAKMNRKYFLYLLNEKIELNGIHSIQ